MEPVSKAQLKQWMENKQNVLLIDTLSKESFQDHHIPGAINIPYSNNADFVDAVRKHVASKDENIVVYCRNLHCSLSREAASKLEEAGFTRVHAFEEGVEGWFGNPAGTSRNAA